MEQFLKAILTQLQLVPGVTDVRLYNSQLKNLNQEEPFLYPAALLEVVELDYTTAPERHQFGTCTVRVHVLTESPLQGQEYDIYQLKELVNQYLYGFTAGFFSPLVRTSEQVDTDHDNIYDYHIEYTTRFQEYIEPLDEQTTILQYLKVFTDLDIDTIVFRTGDNRNYQFSRGTLLEIP